MKNKTLSLLAMVSLFVSISSVVSAEDTANSKTKKTKATSNKPVKKSQKQHKDNHLHQHDKTGKGHMHEIERELDKIYADFKETGNKEVADKQLKAIPGKIDAAVAQMQKSEMHGSMWKRHKHKLNEKLEEITKMIDESH